jgi:Concanavalin A-like lectin/glucanases superfamily
MPSSTRFATLILASTALGCSLAGLTGGAGPSDSSDGGTNHDAEPSTSVDAHDDAVPRDATTSQHDGTADGEAKDAPHDASATRADAKDATPDCTPSFSATVMADQPIAYYPMGETSGNTMFDLGPSSLNGTYGSGVTLGQAGIVLSDPEDTSPHFPGGHYATANTAAVPASAALEPGESFSVELIFEEDAVNPGPGDAGNDGFIDLVDFGWDVQITPINTVKFYMPLNNTDQGTLDYPQPSGTTVLTPGKAYLIDGTYDGMTVTLYLDGDKQNTAAGSGVLDFDSLDGGGISIAATPIAPTRMALRGKIAQLSLYNLTLSADRIAAHYLASGLAGAVSTCKEQ